MHKTPMFPMGKRMPRHLEMKETFARRIGKYEETD